MGNRTTSAAGIPGNPNIYYVGAAWGGIWKTVDGGVHWSPIFDDYGVQSIGALALAPSNPNIVWAGTGEAHIRSHISIRNGVYKSLDAGKTWTRMGLENSGRIAGARGARGTHTTTRGLRVAIRPVWCGRIWRR